LRPGRTAQPGAGEPHGRTSEHDRDVGDQAGDRPGPYGPVSADDAVGRPHASHRNPLLARTVRPAAHAATTATGPQPHNHASPMPPVAVAPTEKDRKSTRLNS